MWPFPLARDSRTKKRHLIQDWLNIVHPLWNIFCIVGIRDRWLRLWKSSITLVKRRESMKLTDNLGSEKILRDTYNAKLHVLCDNKWLRHQYGHVQVTIVSNLSNDPCHLTLVQTLIASGIALERWRARTQTYYLQRPLAPAWYNMLSVSNIFLQFL